MPLHCSALGTGAKTRNGSHCPPAGNLRRTRRMCGPEIMHFYDLFSHYDVLANRCCFYLKSFCSLSPLAYFFYSPSTREDVRPRAEQHRTTRSGINFTSQEHGCYLYPLTLNHFHPPPPPVQGNLLVS